jgi:hypothetical protein
VSTRIETFEVPTSHIDRSHAEADLSGVYAIKIDQPLQRILQARRVVEASRFNAPQSVDLGSPPEPSFRQA